MTTTNNADHTTRLLALMRKGDDTFNARDFAGMKAVHHPDMIAHVMGSAVAVYGEAAHAVLMRQMFQTFPDVHVDNDPYPIQFGNGDWITVVCRITGTFSSALVLPDGQEIAPTGKAFNQDFTTTARWEGDLLIEEYVFWDSALQAQQIGLSQSRASKTLSALV